MTRGAAADGGGDSTGIAGLLDIMARLRDPAGGCPWDLRQDFGSIAPYTVEEAYEVADAIRRGDMDGLRAELGDLLLQVVYHAQMATEAGRFDFADVVAAISAKMIRRHPHVFAGAPRDSFTAADWDREKAREARAGQPAGNPDPAPAGAPASALDGAASPAAPLARAMTLGQRAARVGFDWEDAEGTYRKIAEETAELRAAGDAAARREELGDLLFAVVSLARHLGIDPESALVRANGKFEARFRRLEAILAARGETPDRLSPDELDAVWRAVKAEVATST